MKKKSLGDLFFPRLKGISCQRSERNESNIFEGLRIRTLGEFVQKARKKIAEVFETQNGNSDCRLPSRELTYLTMGKGKSSSKAPLRGDMVSDIFFIYTWGNDPI